MSLFSCLALLSLLRVQRFAVVPWTRYRQKSAEFFGFIGEQIAGREDIRANGAVGYVMQRFYRTLQSWLPLYHQARFTSTLLWTGSVGLFTIGKAIALTLAAYLWQRQAITIGTAYLIFHYANLLSEPIYRIRELLDLQSRLQDTGQISLPTAALSVKLENVWFSYDKSCVIGHSSLVISDKRATNDEAVRPRVDSRRKTKAIREDVTCGFPAGFIVRFAACTRTKTGQRTKDKLWTLQDISLNLPAGKTLGLLGHTGSGKTTLARLLLRFYDIDRGTIYLENTAIVQTPLSELRQRVGIVTQDVQLFQASIRDNLTFFDSTISDTKILSTLEL